MALIYIQVSMSIKFYMDTVFISPRARLGYGSCDGSF